MASSSISNPAHKRQKIETKAENSETKNATNWKTETLQHSYSKNLLYALRSSRNNTLSPPSSAVRVAADRALAVSAKGKTRWSRAILTSRLRRKVGNNSKSHKKAKLNRLRKPVVNDSKLPAVVKKVKVLSRLVPGCKKVSLPNLLEEASDYIAALEMQVRAMSALAELLTGSTDRVGSNVLSL